MADSIQVRTTIKEQVSKPIAVQLCSDFLDWLDGQRWAIAPASTADERDFQDLAQQYVETVAGR